MFPLLPVCSSFSTTCALPAELVAARLQVILIHLSNITGLREDYGKRTMKLLLSDIGTICFGVASAMTAKGPLKIILFMMGMLYGSSTFYTAATLYMEAYHMVPKGQCRALVKAMTYLFYGSWVLFPILFVLGPEGFGHLTIAGSAIGHTVADVMSKNLWGLCGNSLRNKVGAGIRGWRYGEWGM